MSNNITVIGNLTGEPELRYTQGGTAMLTGSIADNRRYQVNGEWQEETSYVNFVAWRDLAENAAATLSKGMRVVVTGRLQQRSYEDKDGNKRSAFDIVVDDIAPSLRFATATVAKTTKPGETISSRPSTPTPEAPAYVDEEPF
jgi:single-strand DNA-binding protein